VDDPVVGAAGDDVFPRSGRRARPDRSADRQAMWGDDDSDRLGDGRGAGVLVNWSQSWEGRRKKIKPFVRDLAADDPNAGLEVVVADGAPAPGPTSRLPID
jgi:hypothetical protein